MSKQPPSHTIHSTASRSLLRLVTESKTKPVISGYCTVSLCLVALIPPTVSTVGTVALRYCVFWYLNSDTVRFGQFQVDICLLPIRASEVSPLESPQSLGTLIQRSPISQQEAGPALMGVLS